MPKNKQSKNLTTFSSDEDYEILLVELLQSLQTGKNKAITSEKLAKRIGLVPYGSNTALRSLIREIISAGIPVGSCTKGYYLIETNEELEENVKELNQRICGIKNRIGDIKKGFKSAQR